MSHFASELLLPEAVAKNPTLHACSQALLTAQGSEAPSWLTVATLSMPHQSEGTEGVVGRIKAFKRCPVAMPTANEHDCAGGIKLRTLR